MERVTFIIEHSQEQVVCLLNPEELTLSRSAGISTRDTQKSLAGKKLKDDPVLFTGGGKTNINFQLLFDVSLISSTMRSPDIRAITSKLWSLTEPLEDNKAPTVRFIWGKAWNILGVITEVSEKLDRFTQQGIPERSWLTLGMQRIDDDSFIAPAISEPQRLALLEDHTSLIAAVEGSSTKRVVVTDSKLDTLAQQHYRDSTYWRLIAKHNDVADPMNVPSGTVLELPTQRGG